MIVSLINKKIKRLPEDRASFLKAFRVVLFTLDKMFTLFFDFVSSVCLTINKKTLFKILRMMKVVINLVINKVIFF